VEFLGRARVETADTGWSWVALEGTTRELVRA